MTRNFRKQCHATYETIYHIVLGAKYRRRIFNDGVFKYMKERLKELRELYPDLDIQEINHGENHVHILIWIPPKYPVSKVVNLIKSNTARELKKKFPFLKKIYWGTESVWSDGYFVSTIGVNEEIIRKYIQQQGEEDAGRAQLAML